MTLMLPIYGSNAAIVNSEIKYFWQIHCLLYGILFNTEVKMRLSSYKAYFIFYFVIFFIIILIFIIYHYLYNLSL